MTAPADAAEPRPQYVVFALASLVAVWLVYLYVSQSGTWLDEYWQLWISGASRDALIGRLVSDVHPPWFNILAKPILALTGDSLVQARLLNGLAAIATFAGVLWSVRHLSSALRLRILLVVVASAGPVGFTELASSFRVYPWLLILAALQATVLLAVAMRRAVPAALGAAITFASIAMHYSHAAGAIAVALVTIVLAFRGEQRSAAFAQIIGLASGIGLDFATSLVQLPHWREHLDVNWIDTSGRGGILTAAAIVFAGFLLFNLAGTILLALGLKRRSAGPVLWVLAPIPIAFAAWALIDLVNPVLLPRHMASVTAMLAVSAALAWHELRLGPASNIAFAAVIAFQPLFDAIVRPPLIGWERGAERASRLLSECPDSTVYAINAWRFRDFPGSRAAKFESPVMELAYARSGRTFGLRPHYVTGTTVVRVGRCPAIIWMEAAHGIERFDPRLVLNRAQLVLPVGLRPVFKFVPIGNGALLLISAGNELEPRND